MNKFINTLKSIDPTPFIAAAAFTLTFAAGLIVGQHTVSREVEVVYHNPYKSLTLDECVTDDPIYLPDSVPIIEPIDCGPGDKECLKQNENAGKPAQTLNLKP